MAGLTAAVQEGLVGLLCFDEKTGALLKSIIPAENFDVYYRSLVDAATKFWAQFGKPPGEHTLDLIDELVRKRPKDKDLLKRLMRSLFESRDRLNAEYLMGQAARFVRLQRMKAGITEAVDLIQADKLDDAETVLAAAMRKSYDLFDPGTFLTDAKRSLAFLHDHATSFPTGISELDNVGLGPVRKELHLFVARPKRGKTWWLVNLGKQALVHGYKVLHVTLEMSEARISQRYMQALFSISKRKAQHKRIAFVKDSLGRLIDLKEKAVPKRPGLNSPGIERYLRASLQGWERRPPLLIKEFPTGSLTVKELEGYLDMLEASSGFMPDLLLLDYADLMNIDTRNYRHELQRVYKDVRGLALTRNIAVATASQANREGGKAKLITDMHAAEADAKGAIVDTMITYNRTPEEKRCALARLFVAAARNDADQFQILISQNYSIGQFFFDSTRMLGRYGDILPTLGGEDEEEDEVDD